MLDRDRRYLDAAVIRVETVASVGRNQDNRAAARVASSLSESDTQPVMVAPRWAEQ
jgi:hypothetical protein